MSRHENDDHFKVLLRRVEALAIQNSQISLDVRRAERAADELHDKALELNEAQENLSEAMSEINRLKKKHPRLVKLPTFMRPQSDDDIPF